MEQVLTKGMVLNKEYPVAMSNNLIKARSNLSLNEIKLLRLTIMQILKTDDDFQTYTVAVKELADLLDIPSANIYRDIDKMTTDIMREIILIGDGDPSHKWEKINWCHKCKYDDGIITIQLHEDLKPQLLKLKNYFTVYQLEEVLSMKSANAIRLYEVLLSEVRNKLPKEDVVDLFLPVELIQEVTGGKGKYNTGMFYKRVIEPSVEEINEKTKYQVFVDKKKQGRKIIGYTFKVTSKVYYRARKEKF